MNKGYELRQRAMQCIFDQNQTIPNDSVNADV